MTMVPPESLLLNRYGYGYQGGCGGGFKGKMKREKHGHEEILKGGDCLGSDPTANINGNNSTNYASMVVDHQDDSRTNSGNEAVRSASKDTSVNTNYSDNYNQDEGWLRLGTGGCTENPPERKHDGRNDDHPKDLVDRTAEGKEGLLELSLFTGGSVVASVSDALPSQVTMNSSLLFPQQYQLGSSVWAIRPQLLHQNSSWMTLMGQYNFVRPFHHPLPGINSYNNNDDQIESSSGFRVIDPPRRPHSGIWFALQASQNQAKEPFLPQVTKSYQRIKEGKMTIGLLKKYLAKKLRLDSESEIEIRCRGQELLPFLTMQHVRDSIWTPKGSSSSVALLPDSTTDHVMILHYGRI